MTLDETISQIKACAKEMDARYGKTVFDEWAVVSLPENKARVLAYIGPRNDDFLKNFAKDLGALRAELLTRELRRGDFEFARHGIGTGFESFMVLGAGALPDLQQHARVHGHDRQKSALARGAGAVRRIERKIRADPLAVAGDDTKFFKKN